MRSVQTLLQSHAGVVRDYNRGRDRYWSPDRSLTPGSGLSHPVLSCAQRKSDVNTRNNGRQLLFTMIKRPNFTGTLQRKNLFTWFRKIKTFTYFTLFTIHLSYPPNLCTVYGISTMRWSVRPLCDRGVKTRSGPLSECATGTFVDTPGDSLTGVAGRRLSTGRRTESPNMSPTVLEVRSQGGTVDDFLDPWSRINRDPGSRSCPRVSERPFIDR